MESAGFCEASAVAGGISSNASGRALGTYRNVGCFQAPLENRIQICSCRKQWAWELKSSICRERYHGLQAC